MTTIIYGASDDLIEVSGDVKGEHCGDHNFLFLSDGTILEVKYGKESLAVWEIRLVEKGALFMNIEPCFDEEASPYSDVASFADGVKWVYQAESVGKVE